MHVTRARRRSGGRRGARVHVHSAPLEADEIVVVDGIAVTSVARTLVDLARQVPFEQAVVTADGAMHRHLVDRPTLDDALVRWGWVDLGPRFAPVAQRLRARYRTL